MTSPVVDAAALEIRWLDGVPVLAPEGELDVLAAEVLGDAAAHMLADERTLVIDLADASVVDVAALLPIVRALRRAVKRGRDVRLVNVPAAVEALASTQADLGHGLRLGTRSFVSLSN